MSATNTYTGNTTLSAGAITVSGTGALGTVSPMAYAGQISLASGTTFTYGSSVDQEFSGKITGAGALTKATSARARSPCRERRATTRERPRCRAEPSRSRRVQHSDRAQVRRPCRLVRQ
ncbi:MAG: hypothetical protein EBQ75_00830 [Actinobacteria bacterium]|nr:hypothetical protein [Actinomycetota bacterium]